MIQRIQSVYLLLVVGLLALAICLPLGYFLDANALPYKFTAFGVAVGDVTHASWGLFCLLLLAAIVAFATIFLYRNRILQIRMTIFNSLLLIGFYIAFLVFMFAFQSKLDMMAFRVSWSLPLPLIAIILNYLAIRAIGRDEVLVKAADRLR